MTDRVVAWIVFLFLMAIALGAVHKQVVDAAACHDRGGAYVRATWWFKCLRAEEIT